MLLNDKLATIIKKDFKLNSLFFISASSYPYLGVSESCIHNELPLLENHNNPISSSAINFISKLLSNAFYDNNTSIKTLEKQSKSDVYWIVCKQLGEIFLNKISVKTDSEEAFGKERRILGHCLKFIYEDNSINDTNQNTINIGFSFRRHGSVCPTFQSLIAAITNKYKDWRIVNKKLKIIK